MKKQRGKEKAEECKRAAKRQEVKAVEIRCKKEEEEVKEEASRWR